MWVALVVLCLCAVAPSAVDAEHVRFTKSGAVVVMGDHQLVTIPLEANVDDHSRTQLLMMLKQRWEEIHTSTMLEEGSSMELQSGKEIPLDVEILSNKHLATYFGVIEMEKTRFKVLFDTGSCEFWVPSAACTTARCMKHSRLPVAQRRIATEEGMNIQYLSGKVQGDMVYETVRLGDISVENQVVGLAKVVDIELLDDVRWDGIMGLAYPNPTLSARGVTPIFDTIIKSRVLTKRHLSNQFAYYIDDHKGAVTFGGADCDLIAKGEAKAKCIDQFQFVPVTEKTYWTITIKDVHIKYPGKQEQSGFCPEGGCKAIVDTGTYLIYGPSNQVTSMVTSQLASCSKHREMPTFIFDFAVNDGDDPVKVKLEPRDYILKFDMNEKTDCVVGISPDKDTIWTLGQVFLRSFYTVFDRDENRVGFARLPRDHLEALNSRSTLRAVEARREKEREHRKERGSFLETQDRSRAKQHLLNRLRVRDRRPATVSDVDHSDSASPTRVAADNSESAAALDRGHDKDNRMEQSLTENEDDPEQRKQVHVVMDGLRHIHYDRVV